MDIHSIVFLDRSYFDVMSAQLPSQKSLPSKRRQRFVGVFFRVRVYGFPTVSLCLVKWLLLIAGV